VSEVNEDSSTAEILDMLSVDCAWAAEVVGDRIEELEAERDKLKATLVTCKANSADAMNDIMDENHKLKRELNKRRCACEFEDGICVDLCKYHGGLEAERDNLREALEEIAGSGHQNGWYVAKIAVAALEVTPDV
jgi:hypothetical protein